MRKQLAAIFAAIALTVGLITASVRYYHFVSQTIYTESTAHLTEIYHQANQSLHNLVSKNWSAMRMWVPYLRDTANEELVESYIENTRKEIGFTNFYFISREGNYQALDGSTGYLDLKERLPKLILQGEDVVVNSVVPGKPEIMVFAVPAVPGSYQGFDYEAIAISFNNSDLVEALEISAFGGQSSTYPDPSERVLPGIIRRRVLRSSSETERSPFRKEWENEQEREILREYIVRIDIGDEEITINVVNDLAEKDQTAGNESDGLNTNGISNRFRYGLERMQ